jgi:polyhydroxyalkanoate synthesis regulator phasin
MRDLIKKSFLLGLGAASMTMGQAEKIVQDLVKRNAVSVEESRQMLNKVKKATLSESSRIRKLAQKEAKRISTGLGIESKIQLHRLKAGLKSIDRELSAEGKKSLGRIIKEISR